MSRCTVLIFKILLHEATAFETSCITLHAEKYA